jgi:hypothetical protein
LKDHSASNYIDEKYNRNRISRACSDNHNKEEISEIVRKIDLITTGQRPYLKRVLLDMVLYSSLNAKNICNFIIAERNEINIKGSPIEWHVKVLGQIQKFLDFKDFSLITKEDIINYLDSLRKIRNPVL